MGRIPRNTPHGSSPHLTAPANPSGFDLADHFPAPIHPSTFECGECECIHPWKGRMNGGICYSCSFWRGVSERARLDERSVVVEGVHYTVSRYQNVSRVQSSGLGFGGTTFLVRWFDGRRYVSNDLWKQGEIPPHFRGRLPDSGTLERLSGAALEAVERRRS